MKATDCSKYDNYLDIDGTMILIDRPNRRIKILNHQDLSGNTLSRIKTLAVHEHMRKIVSFVPESSLHLFITNDFKLEGTIAGFFRGRDAFCCSYFVTGERIINHDFKIEGDWLSKCGLQSGAIKDSSVSKTYDIRDAQERDIPGMIRLFRSVFKTYPSPVFSEDYIRRNIRTNKVQYKAAIHKGNIIGIASADKDYVNLNAEMTDCVTNPAYRGQGINRVILTQLENELHKQGFISVYTLCRAAHPAINIVFTRLRYVYSGCMVNNCNICGAFENMNILVKLMNPSPSNTASSAR